MNYFWLGIIGALINLYWARSRKISPWGWTTLGFLLPVLGNAAMWYVVERKRDSTPSSLITPEVRLDLTELPPPNISPTRPVPPSRRADVSASQFGRPYLVIGEGWFATEVVGESNYFESIRKISRSVEGELFTSAVLIHEMNNRHDKNAVRVDVDGQTVGYIGREDAPDFAKAVDFTTAMGRTFVVDAKVWWGGDYGSVQLDCGEPSFAVCVNAELIDEGSLVWPVGRRIQVTKESEHMDAIGQLLARSYSETGCAAFIEVKCVENEKGKRIVELEFDGRKVGELSPQSSGKYWPAFSKISTGERRLFVVAEITGNELAAEVVLRVKPPEELNREELADLRR